MARMAPGERPTLALSLRRARKAAGFKNAASLLEALTASGFHAPSYSTYAGWESGAVEPREESVAPIIAFHQERGTWETTKEPDPSVDVAGLVVAFTEALKAQTRYLSEIGELRAEVAAQTRAAEDQRLEMARLLGSLSDQLDELRVLAGTQAGSAGTGPGLN